MIKIELVRTLLDEKYPDPHVSLDYTTPFQLLIATLLSAQCHDEQVNKVTPVLFQKASTPEQMRSLGETEIGKLIYSCGFYRTKSHYIAQLSKQLCERFGGAVPDTFEDLESLPGIGHKTASVVMMYAFGYPAFPVDTHIHRVAMQWGLSKGPTVERVEKDLKTLFHQNLWYKLHLQMINYGRKFCNHVACKKEHPCPICKALNIYKIC